MDINTTTTSTKPNKRLYPRHNCETRIYIHWPDKKRTLHKCVNISNSGAGVAVITTLKVGTKIPVTFVITLGNVTKLHRRETQIIHITKGIVGIKFIT